MSKIEVGEYVRTDNGEIKLVTQELKDFINEYESLNEAELKTNVKYQYISSCCRGISKTAGGFIWEYKQ